MPNTCNILNQIYIFGDGGRLQGENVQLLQQAFIYMCKGRENYYNYYIHHFPHHGYLLENVAQNRNNRATGFQLWDCLYLS